MSHDISHSDLLVDVLLENLQKSDIEVFGDSHAYSFSNLNRVRVNHIGPVTAFNLQKENSSTRGRETLFGKLRDINPLTTAIILSFGEIDCRVHIIKQAIDKKMSMKEVTSNTVYSYLKVIDEIMTLGFTVLVLGISGTGQGMNLNFPKTGKEQERNYVISVFNSMLREESRKKKFYFCDMQNIIVNIYTLKSRHSFLKDGCHLNKFPATEKELQSIIVSRFIDSIQTEIEFTYLNKKESFQRINHAEGARYILSSSYRDYPNCGIIKKTENFFFHTDFGKEQSIDIYFDCTYVIDEIVIHNRLDSCYDRANNLSAIISVIGKEEPIEILIPTSPDFLSGHRVCTVVKFEPLLCYKLQIFSKNETYLHFSYIEINGDYPFLGYPIKRILRDPEARSCSTLSLIFFRFARGTYFWATKLKQRLKILLKGIS